MLRNGLFVLSLLLFGTVAGLGGYYAGGRSDAIDDTRPLIRLADRLIARGEGGEGLGGARQELLLAAQDPRLTQRNDMAPASVGMLSRSLAKRLAAERSDPSFSAIRQAGYASGLETRLSQTQLMALWLETVDMGRSRNGWVRGFYQASRSLYDRPPAQLDDARFLRLIAVATAPSSLQLDSSDTAVEARIGQILRIIERHCARVGSAPEANDFCTRR
jgi:hypothetical protein